MKRKLLLLFLTVIAAVACAFGFAACDNETTPPPDKPGPGEVVKPNPSEECVHSYVNYVYNDDATCTADGTETAKCEKCGETEDTRTKVGSKLPHKEQTLDAVPATCTEAGLTAGKKCTNCDTVLVEQTTVPANGHTEVDDDAVPANCTATGLTAGKHCSVCDTVLVAQTTVPANGHTEVDDDAVPATCTQTGLTAGKHCSVCYDVLVEQTTVPANGHTEADDDAVPATCTQTGLTAGKHCSVCDTVIEAQTTVPAKGHKYEDYVSDGNATCTQAGTKTAQCENGCGETDRIPEEKLGHDFDEGVCKRCHALQPTEGLRYESYLDYNDYQRYYSVSMGTATDTDIIVASDYEGIPVKRMGYGAFSNCTNLTSITIPDSMQEISSDAFKNCGITKIYYKGSVADWCKIKGLEYIMASGRSLYIGDTEVTGDFEIPEGVTEIGTSAFAFCEGLKSVTFPESVTKIGEYAFRACSSLSIIFMREGLTTISASAFYWCLDLKSVKIPASVTTIEKNAFNCCNGLTIYCVAEEQPSGWNNSWNFTYYLHNAYYGGKLPVIWNCNNNLTDSDGYTYKYLGKLRYQLKDGEAVVYMQPTTLEGSIVIHSTVTDTDNVTTYTVTGISEYAFGACNDLTSVIVDNGVTSIGQYAFYDCTSLTTITIPMNVTTIGTAAFSGCTALTISCEAETAPAGYAYNWAGYDAVVIWNCSENNADSKGNIYKEIGGIRYSLKDGVATVIRQARNTATANIRATVTYNSVEYNVTSIGSNAFYACDKLTSVTIPDSVTSIGSNAFYGCIGLTGVTIPDSVTSIGSQAFYACDKLTSVTIPGSVTSIGSQAFYDCKGLTSVTISDGVTQIEYNAFYGCKGLTSVTIPDSVTSIDSQAFCGCSSLTSITIPDGVRGIYCNAFNDTAYYKDDSNWENGVLYIGNHLIQLKSSVTGVFEIKQGAVSSARDAFRNFEGSVVIPSSFTSIGFKAFSYCSGLTSITIPESVTSIGNEAFYGCSSLTSITLPDGVISIGDKAFYESGLTSITLPDSLTSIGDEAFRRCYSLTSIIIPEKVTEIGEYAFYYDEVLIIYCEVEQKPEGWHSSWNYGYCPVVWNCKENDTDSSGYAYAMVDGIRYSLKDGEATVISQLSNIVTANIPATVTYKDDEYSVTSIDYEAFSYCSSLTSITIPDGVTFIGNRAFYECEELTSITIGDGVTGIYYTAFDDSGYYNDENNWIDGALYIGNHLIKIKTPVSDDYEVKQGTVSLAHNVFRDFKDLTSVTLPDSLTYIGDYAFSGCSDLTSVNIPDNVTYIGNEAFYECSSLASVTIPDNVTHIGNEAFYGCSSLTSLILGNSLTYIGDSAFYYCHGLTTVIIPESVTTVGERAFANCELFVIYCEAEEKPEGWHSSWRYGWNEDPCPVVWNCNTTDADSEGNVYAIIGDFRYSFNDGVATVAKQSKDIVTAEIPDTVTYKSDDYSVTSIAEKAFYNCKSLTSVTIPDSVTSIDYNAFYGCILLTSIIIPESVTSMGNEVFRNVDNLTIYCEAEEKPDGWYYDWNYYYNPCPVVWNCKENDKDKNGYSYAIIKGVRYSLKGGVATVIEQPTNIVTANIPATVTYKEAEYSVTSIKDYAFNECSSLTSVTIPDSVTSIGAGAFWGCSSLTSIRIPASVTDIGSQAIYQCDKYLTIYCEVESKLLNWNSQWNFEGRPVIWDCNNNDKDKNGYAYTVVDGVRYSLKDGEATVIGQSKDIVTANIVSTVTYKDEEYSVTSIVENAFYECKFLTIVTIPDSVTFIGNYAFWGCSSLTSVTIGSDESGSDSTTSIGRSAFHDCRSLTSVTIGSNVTSIGNYAFSGCRSLKSITIPESVTGIGDRLFENCNKVTIYCEVESRPYNWSYDWNYDNRPVIWDCKNVSE